MKQLLLIELVKYFKRLLFIWDKASKGWIIQYIGGNKFLFLKKLRV